MGYANGKSIQLLFFEKYHILAVYGNNGKENTLLGRHILRATGNIVKPHRIYMDQSEELFIERVNTVPAGSISVEFCFTGQTSSVFKDETRIVIGTGDIRDGISDLALTRIEIPVSTLVSDDLIISCTADFKLKIQLKKELIKNGPTSPTCS